MQAKISTWPHSGSNKQTQTKRTPQQPINVKRHDWARNQTFLVLNTSHTLSNTHNGQERRWWFVIPWISFNDNPHWCELRTETEVKVAEYLLQQNRPYNLGLLYMSIRLTELRLIAFELCRRHLPKFAPRIWKNGIAIAIFVGGTVVLNSHANCFP